MGIGFRIKEAREQLGLTQTELGNIIGVTGSAITNYEKETSHPKETIIYKLFDALKVDANYLFQDEMGSDCPMKVSYNEMEHIRKYRALDEHGKEMVDFILLKEGERSTALIEVERENKTELSPIRHINYYYRLASAGTGQIIFDIPPTERIEIPDLPKYKKADYAIGVNGNSMEPIYKDGDTLLVEMINEIAVGEIGIFTINGECFVKKLEKSELVSLNPEYPNIPLNETAKCMGRVIDKIQNQME